MAKTKTKLFLLTGLLSVFLATSGLSCKLFPTSQAPTSLTKEIELEYWGVWDDSDYLQPLINEFESLHPNISVNYRKFQFAEYEQNLLEAWAEDRGPDIYSLPASWLKEYKTKITPQPEAVRLAFQQTEQKLGKTETTTFVRNVPIFKPSDIKNQFVDVVYQDVVIDNQIYGLPYSVDTLALFYNRDLLDKAGVPTPPSNWTEVAEAVKKITQVNQNNEFIQSGIALGTADNINNSVDIVSMLMMQNGAQMIKNGNVSFHLSVDGYRPGLEALNFYSDFADPIKEVYSWSNDQPNSLDAFMSGQLAMIITYSYNLPRIKARAPKIDLGIARLPQIKDTYKTVNYTNYWVETVAHKTANAEAAWGFLNFASSEDHVSQYLAKAKKPTALRNLIESQITDPEIGVFASQVLTATGWYRGQDALKMEEIMRQLIKDLPNSPQPEKLLETAAAQVNQTL
ncbi:MAG: hypothetical protein COU22_00390 [Candidatus Komeilibacteria bacterium CG10_big_fil_rev_8_21_14_0_10_41_13]|uniref:ABC transporter substrate-binding protein n=1 Tax=Candidatus Komeilibacteria bacterium CG10_big_fil_rev_8_21_14_0_10_41_13 TaxID=1974476 RepID=A0A2M6WD77_9BACT|nr:MAG: hypothetical protein COU22_00390 [Candidatus Komeilibacteria bacterium CG10_big_fil_rev_8_21_14_0_10_41_13]